jgi:biopolymer transport protein TolR
MAEATPQPHKKKPILHSHDATRPVTLGATSDINITPLIDVMLVLLIIFMVVTPLAQKGLDIALPQPPPPNQPIPTTPPNVVVLSVEEALISVNKSPVGDMNELEQRLRDLYQTRSDKTIFVRATGAVPYGKVVAAMDAAKGAGVERIGIISEKMIEQSGGAATGE